MEQALPRIAQGSARILRRLSMGGWALGGFYRDPDYDSFYFNVAFLGSYSGKYTIPYGDPENRRALISFFVVNTTSVETATRIPIIGHLPGSPIKSVLSSKVRPDASQVFRWSELIDY